MQINLVLRSREDDYQRTNLVKKKIFWKIFVLNFWLIDWFDREQHEGVAFKIFCSLTDWFSSSVVKEFWCSKLFDEIWWTSILNNKLILLLILTSSSTVKFWFSKLLWGIWWMFYKFRYQIRSEFFKILHHNVLIVPMIFTKKK